APFLACCASTKNWRPTPASRQDEHTPPVFVPPIRTSAASLSLLSVLLPPALYSGIAVPPASFLFLFPFCFPDVRPDSPSAVPSTSSPSAAKTATTPDQNVDCRKKDTTQG
ncbi:unnamed protein product, partial [Ectocarpus sp. 13 AM-2016]